jgi:hypothetical protein
MSARSPYFVEKLLPDSVISCPKVEVDSVFDPETIPSTQVSQSLFLGFNPGLSHGNDGFTPIHVIHPFLA